MLEIIENQELPGNIPNIGKLFDSATFFPDNYRVCHYMCHYNPLLNTNHTQFSFKKFLKTKKWFSKSGLKKHKPQIIKFIYSEKASKIWRNLQTFFDAPN